MNLVKRFLVFVPDRVRPENERFFLVVNFAILISGIGHFSFIPLFAVLEVYPLVFYNCGSVVLFTLMWFLNRRGMHYLAVAASVMEFTGHAWLAVNLLGWDFGFRYYVIGWCFVPFLAPAGRLWFKYGIFFLNAASFIAMSQYAKVSPLMPDAWQLKAAGAINAFNFVFFCGGFAFAFFHFRNLVDKAECTATRALMRSEWLLHNILPATIAERLKSEPTVIADAHSAVSVLFLDIANFTNLAERLAPESLVKLLNAIFSALDELAESHGVEKIKTIGDPYMVAASVPLDQPDHAARIGRFALDACDVVLKISEEEGEPISLRIGIDTGPVVAGVIGARKFTYDLWGDTVNTASRMESHGALNQIHTTKSYRDSTKELFEYESRGVMAAKGK